MSEVAKLTKKQLKALEFRKSKDAKAVKREAPVESDEPAKKKRKTRRGRKGKPRAGSDEAKTRASRFVVFVGNLPRDVTPAELQAHFKSSGPDYVRVRNDKHIAFLEFTPETKNGTPIQSRMDIALMQHKTLLRGQRINVELTAGGGGNSSDRLEKLRNKNAKLEEERKERLTKMIKDDAKRKEVHSTGAHKASDTIAGRGPHTPGGVHPDRAHLLQ